MNRGAYKSLCVLVIAAGAIIVWASSSDAADDDASETHTKPIRVTSLNTGKYTLIGRLDYPLGSYHIVRATFGMPVPKGRAGNGGRIYLQVIEVDGQELDEPQWIPYFKSMTLQNYSLPDGTNLFPNHPDTQSLNGKTVVCKVYEDIIFLDIGGDVSQHFGDTQQHGFDMPHYETALGILSVLE